MKTLLLYLFVAGAIASVQAFKNSTADNPIIFSKEELKKPAPTFTLDPMLPPPVSTATPTDTLLLTVTTDPLIIFTGIDVQIRTSQQDRPITFMQIETKIEPVVVKRGDKWVIIIAKPLSGS